MDGWGILKKRLTDLIDKARLFVSFDNLLLLVAAVHTYAQKDMFRASPGAALECNSLRTNSGFVLVFDDSIAPHLCNRRGTQRQKFCNLKLNTFSNFSFLFLTAIFFIYFADSFPVSFYRTRVGQSVGWSEICCNAKFGMTQNRPKQWFLSVTAPAHPLQGLHATASAAPARPQAITNWSVIRPYW